MRGKYNSNNTSRHGGADRKSKTMAEKNVDADTREKEQNSNNKCAIIPQPVFNQFSTLASPLLADDVFAI